MKAHSKQLEKTISKEVQLKYDDIVQETIEETAPQLIGTLLYTLDKCYGWRKDRLKNFFENFQDICKLMDTNSRLNGKFSGVDTCNYIKKHYGIDIAKEMRFEHVEHI